MKYTALLLCGCVLTRLSYAQEPRHATSSEPPSIQVSGECLKKVAQDRGSITVTTSIVASTPQEASQQATQSHERIKEELKKLKLSDAALETVNYSVTQECSYDQGKRMCQGYRATYATRFETSEIGRIGEVISLATKSPSREVSDLQTFVSPAKLKSERATCLEVATADAHSKALSLARGAQVTLGDLRFLGESGDAGHPIPIMSRSTLALAHSDAAVAAPSVETKPIDLRVTVLARYDFR